MQTRLHMFHMDTPPAARSCDQVDCDRPVSAKAMCRKHYLAAWRATDKGKATQAAALAAWRATDKGKASTAAYRTSDKGKAAATAGYAAYRASDKGKATQAAALAAWRATDKGKASMAAYSAAYHATDKGKASLRAIQGVRRARKAGATIGGPFTHADIFDRDGWTCGVCGLPVDRALAYPDPASASLDHVIPLAKGGAHSEANVQLAHLVCNMSKGARLTSR